jgi:sphingolipid 4-desaturase/C4-monooxygenase
MQFFSDDQVLSHRKRQKLILEAHPEVSALQGHDSMSFWIILGLVLVQLLGAYLVASSGWLIVILASYLWGAIWAHALYVMIHEACHNLVFKQSWANKVAGLVCDIPLVFPSALAFRHYHMVHHRHLGHEQKDPDVCGPRESKLVSNSWWRKLLWISLFSFSQALRPFKLPRNLRKFDGWMAINILVCLVSNFLVFIIIGPKGLAFLFLSMFFSLGLHPLGGRWLQEHYTLNPKQETYSYYGPLNILTFNIGYHNEHHDLMQVPWRSLPKLKSLAPEFYESLEQRPSLTKMLINFIRLKSFSPYSRVVRRG